ncbi:13211_t:CDS:2, partial [Cetraspora pellucida]
ESYIVDDHFEIEAEERFLTATADDYTMRNKWYEEEEEVRYQMILESVILETFDIGEPPLNDEKEGNKNELEALRLEKNDDYVIANTSGPRRLECIGVGRGALIKSMPKITIEQND